MMNNIQDLSGLINALQNIGQQVGELNRTLNLLLPSGAYEPFSQADGAALNGTLYYSTTANKLVFKDFGGVVNNLY